MSGFEASPKQEPREVVPSDCQLDSGGVSQTTNELHKVALQEPSEVSGNEDRSVYDEQVISKADATQFGARSIIEERHGRWGD